MKTRKEVIKRILERSEKENKKIRLIFVPAIEGKYYNIILN